MDKRVAETNDPDITAHYVNAMAGAAFGVSIVTTNGAAGRFGMTVSAISSVSAEPPILLACINRKNSIAAAITANARFTVNILAQPHITLAKSFSGRPEEGSTAYDFSDFAWHNLDDQFVIGDAAATFLCDLETHYDSGTHRIFLGRVFHASHSGAAPLIYSHRKFGRFEETD